MGYLKRANVKLVDLKKQDKIEDQIRQLVRQFFFFQYSNPFDIYFENQYLESKQEKALQFYIRNKAYGTNKKNMIFTIQNLKRFQNIINFKARNLDYFDDFLPLYFSGNLENTIKLFDSYYSADIKRSNISFYQHIWQGIKDKFFYLKRDQLRQRQFFDEMTSTIQRLENITESIELSNVLGIPPDFFVQNSFLHFHIWLIWNRLSEFKDHPRAQMFCAKIDSLLLNYVFQKCHQITTTSKQNTLFQEMQGILENNRLLYMHHFLYNEQTMNDLLYKADAMVYLCIFQHKIGRYDDRIYKMAYYCVEAYETFKNLSADQILNQEYDFNVFKIPINYKEQLLRKNPQLTQQELQIEMSKRPEETRKIDYVFMSKKYTSKKLIDKQQNSNVQKLMYRINYLANKFRNLKNYDIYEQREQIEQQNQNRQKKYAWKISLNNKSENLSKEFNSEENRIQKIKISNRSKIT